MLKLNSITTALKEDFAALFPEHTAYTDYARQGFERPSFLVELGPVTMEDASARCVDMTAQAKITLFEVVDDYHDAQLQVLAEGLVKAMAHLSGRTVKAEDRYLDIGKVTGTYGLDYAELTFPLTWQDDRALNGPDFEPAKYYDLTIEINKEEQHNG